MQVEFLGEQGSDTGGLTREFFDLVGYHASAKYFEPTGCFKHNSVAFQVSITQHVGHGVKILPLVEAYCFVGLASLTLKVCMSCEGCSCLVVCVALHY